jgi:hypothetical protein
MTFTNGDVYEGDWMNDKAHVKGKLTRANGDVYEGDFVSDTIQGKVEYTWRVYEGDSSSMPMYWDGEWKPLQDSK